MKPDERERFLNGLLAGELDPDDPQVRARLAAEPELAEEYDGMVRLAKVLDVGGEFEREVVDECAGVPSPDEVRAVLDTLDAERASGPAASSPGSRSRVWLAAAAGLLLALGVYLGSLLDDGPARPDQLGGELELTQVSGDGPFGTFTWDDGELEAARYEVGVAAIDGTALGAPGEFPLLVFDPTWTPTDTIAAEWPATIRLTVVAFDASGARLGTHTASFERLSP